MGAHQVALVALVALSRPGCGREAEDQGDEDQHPDGRHAT
jgi:hypothetical protein